MINVFKILLILSVLNIPLFSFVGCDLLNEGENPKDTSKTEPPVLSIYTHVLPVELNENSGIIYYNGLIWTFNDSGSDPDLYALSVPEGEVKHKVMFKGADNVDWEDIAQDLNYIYLGDFGNNNGNRVNLSIYKFPKDLITNSEEMEIVPEKITFNYEDQTDFSMHPNQNSFDCEAFFSTGDSLYLLSKGWINEISSVYRIPSAKGDYIARKISTLPVAGLVTGVDYLSEFNEIVLCGYSDYIPFVAYTSMDEMKNSKIKNRYIFFNYLGAQTEGVCFYKGDTILISSEASELPARIYFTLK